MADVTKYQFLKKLATLPFVEAIYLYGSRARKDHDPRSDIDLAISCPKASAEDWVKLLDIIDNADTLLKIDCVRFDQLSEGPLKKSIQKYGKTIYDKKA